MTFDVTAPGICALTPEYAADAPAAIEYGGSVYVQSARSAAPPSPPGTALATSGSWVVREAPGASALYLVAGDTIYTYRLTTGC